MENNTQGNTIITQQPARNPYLVTTAVNLGTFSANKLEDDLAKLESAERKSNYKTNIAKGIKNPQLYRAMSSLRLTNPFKGV